MLRGHVHAHARHHFLCCRFAFALAKEFRQPLSAACNSHSSGAPIFFAHLRSTILSGSAVGISAFPVHARTAARIIFAPIDAGRLFCHGVPTYVVCSSVSVPLPRTQLSADVSLFVLLRCALSLRVCARAYPDVWWDNRLGVVEVRACPRSGAVVASPPSGRVMSLFSDRSCERVRGPG